MVETGESTWDHEIALVKQGDEPAARRLVDVLYPQVIRIVRSHLPNRSDDDDATQEVFMKMFTRIDQYRADQGLFDHWVARIAVNHCRDRLRSLRSRRVLSYAELDADETTFVSHLLARDDSAAAAERSEETLAVLEKLLSGLNERERIVIRLLDLEQRPVREVAELTGWGESKIKVTAMRARRHLGERLAALERRAAP
jgi:RNA polymerase sigma-70 factor (ECF subfamily)